MKSIFKYTTILATAVVFFFACEKDDYTGDSKLNPSNPTITISGVDAAGYNFIEKDTVITFDVTLSEPQIVDVQLTVKQIAGDATILEDYSVVNSGSEVVIPAYATAGKLSIKIMKDDLAEDVETFTLQIGDEATANAALTPVTAVFTIGNYTESLFEVEMSWTTDIASVIGIDTDPEDAADLVMLIFDNSDQSPVDTIDGSAFESYDGWEELPDGEYAIGVNVYAVPDAGDFDETFNIDVNLVFNQAGVINDLTLNFPKILTSVVYPCNDYRVNLAVITKSGTTYTATKKVTIYPVIDEIKVEWYGMDTEFEYPSEVTTYEACSETYITGLNNGWIFDFWGEEIVQSAYVSYTIDALGNIDIPEQDYFTTLYDGSEYLYQIVGSGTLDESGLFPVMHIEYEIIQDGFYPGQWAFDEEYMSTPYFVADLTLDPAAMASEVAKTLRKFPLIKKPVR